MPSRLPRSKYPSVLEKRLGRSLSADETLRLAAYARALKHCRKQQRIYKPRMELWDDGDNPVITAMFELPGMPPDEVSVDIVDGRLIVSGERRRCVLSKAPIRSDSEDILCESIASPSGILQVRELKYGFFRRVLAVPAGCTTEDLEASMENGMLTVSWPRSPTQSKHPGGLRCEGSPAHGTSMDDVSATLRLSARNSSRSM